MPRKAKRPRDPNQLAKAIVDNATGETLPESETKPEDEGKNPAAVELGRLGGLRGGKARWKDTTKKQRSEAARKAAMARWKKIKSKEVIGQ
ncbi:MAG: hypothetical protein HY304_09615 [candidate division Zixibacteria bacterium]|nr:hypothetical protein [candidate division Zixibacteria bacterium]